MPIVANFYKGLAVSVPHLSQLPAGTTGQKLREAYAQRYAGERFMRVMPLSDPATLEDGFFDVQACNDTNRVDIFVFASDTQALLMARLDNLGKGASGAAVQAMNVHLGVDEGLGFDARRRSGGRRIARAVVVGVGVGEAEPVVDRTRRVVVAVDLQIGVPRTIAVRLGQHMGAEAVRITLYPRAHSAVKMS